MDRFAGSVLLMPRLSRRAASIASILLAAAVAVADFASPIYYVFPVLAGIPLFLAAAAGSRRFLWAMTVVLVAMTFAAYLKEQPDELRERIVLTNRTMAALVILAVAALLHRLLNELNVVEKQREDLVKQNEEEEAVNQELSQREEEIVRQNEELQSQTEELERQSEELRVTNEELADRERSLEHLLELSRSLTADLTRKEMLQKVCEALGVLMDGNPSAILEKDGNELKIPCYHGFGDEGLESETLPYEQSFAALIMGQGQTGYIEDTRLRPNLKLPRPKNGEPPRSVLSTPMRVYNHSVGAIEVYSSQEQSWAEGQIAILESLAAQMSISLQSIDLVETIRLERRRFESAFRTVPFGLMVAEDSAGQSVRLNPMAAAIFNVPLDENLAISAPAGARLKRYIFRDNRPVPEADLPLSRALRGEEVIGEEIEVVFPQGRRVTLLIGASPILDSRGAIAGAVAGFAEITVQKSLQRELDLRRREAEEANVRKTRFLASVSHDIRTPVNAINLMAEVIRRAGDNPAMTVQIPEMARKLQSNALSLAELVTDILDVARFDSGRMEIQENDFLLNELMAEECRHLLPLAQDKKLRLNVETPDRPIWLRTDRVKLARILGNLLGNAIKFTDHGEVRLGAALNPQREVVLRVADTGVGISADQLPHIFDEFHQLQNPARDRDKGSGLGLTICKQLVEILGGAIKTAQPRPLNGFGPAVGAQQVALRQQVLLGQKNRQRIKLGSIGTAATPYLHSAARLGHLGQDTAAQQFENWRVPEKRSDADDEGVEGQRQ